MISENWFETWFDTPYYHQLYRNRDEDEAREFIRNLLNFIKLKEGSKVLDLACGKGRHALQLCEAGFIVTGSDLSQNSIHRASELAKENLRFVVQDMRETMKNERYDAVLNLFTSFGYFDDTSENQKVIASVYEMLENKGLFIIDFMNVSKVLANLVKQEEKIVDGITFHIERKADTKHIYKFIRFHDNGQDHEYMERVQALTKEDFKALLKNKSFEILHTFGNYKLELFDESTSDRLILIAQKQ